jgi:hypothetical protein
MAQVYRVAEEVRSARPIEFSFFPFLIGSQPGDLIYLNAAGQPIVIINSQKVAVELLDRRAGIYSDRPSDVVACDIMTGGLLLGFARYGET